MDLALCLQVRDQVAEALHALHTPSIGVAPLEGITRVALLPWGACTADKPHDGLALHYATLLSDDVALPAIRCVLESYGIAPGSVRIARSPNDLDAWPAPWSLTAHPSDRSARSLLLAESPDGAVQGVALYSPLANFYDQIARTIYEPEDVQTLFDFVRLLAPETPFFGGFKSHDVSASTLDAAIAGVVRNDRDRFLLFVYRNNQWFFGLSNEQVPLQPLANLYGWRTTALVTSSRPPLDIARSHQTMAGDPDVLRRAIAAAASKGVSLDDGPAERSEINLILCDWWNTHAPESERHAGFFKAYFWDADTRWFIAGDDEEPARDASCFHHSYALFDACDGIPRATVIAFFQRLPLIPDGTHWLAFRYANGNEAYEVGMTHAEAHAAGRDFDEASRGVFAITQLIDRHVEPAAANPEHHAAQARFATDSAFDKVSRDHVLESVPSEVDGELVVVPSGYIVAGDNDVLKLALAAALAPFTEGLSFEAHPANRILCDWWNTLGLKDESRAGFFKAYYMDPDDATFIPAGDNGEARKMKAFPNNAFALFAPRDGIPLPIIIEFYEPQQLRPDDGVAEWLRYRLVNGSEVLRRGMSHAKAAAIGWDEARFGIAGLKTLAGFLNTDDLDPPSGPPSARVIPLHAPSRPPETSPAH